MLFYFYLELENHLNGLWTFINLKFKPNDQTFDINWKFVYIQELVLTYASEALSLWIKLYTEKEIFVSDVQLVCRLQHWF